DEAIPDKSSFTRARQRLGAGVLEAVFRRLAGPVAPAGLAGAFWRGMRVAAVDGFLLDVPDTPWPSVASGAWETDSTRRRTSRDFSAAWSPACTRSVPSSRSASPDLRARSRAT